MQDVRFNLIRAEVKLDPITNAFTKEVTFVKYFDETKLYRFYYAYY